MFVLLVGEGQYRDIVSSNWSAAGWPVDEEHLLGSGASYVLVAHFPNACCSCCDKGRVAFGMRQQLLLRSTAST